MRGKNASGKMADIVAVEALRSPGSGGAQQWVIKSNRRFKIVDKNNNIIQNTPLNPLELHRIQSMDGKLKYVLYTEPLSDDRKQYIGYELVGERVRLKIGREANNSIVYANDFASSNHAELIISPNGIQIHDLGSVNNTYVNGRAVKQETLSIGDVIYIMGLQIVVTNKHIFLNNPDGNVKVESQELREYHAPQSESNITHDTEYEEEFEDIPDDFYYRAPRFKHDVDTFELKMDAPPSNQNSDEVPMIMLIGPSMTMGMASISMGAFAVINAVGRGDITAAIPSIVMSLSMLLGTLMWPLVTKRYQRRMRERNEARRQEAYKEYLVQMEELVAREITRQEQVLRDNDANTLTYVNRILSPVPQIWERTPKHTDFLSIRLGYGNLPLKANIQYTERRFSIEHDNLAEAMYQFGERKRWLSNVPVCLPLAERFISGVYADRKYIFPYAKSLILQLVALHSYDEVKIVLIYDESDADEFAFVRWLPHAMNNERSIRYIATNSDEAKELSVSIDSIIERRKQLDKTKLEDESPYFVILCLDKELASKTECVRRIQEHKGNLRFSVISFFERLKDLPKECASVVELRGGSAGNLTSIGDVSEPSIAFNTDAPQQIDIGRVTEVLANTVINTSDSMFALPRKYTFFELLDVGMIEHLNLIDNWSANDPTESLAAVIGVDKYGEAFKLDLHERAHGPHGLVAGMTGSGKSEFIIAYILSMAANFHPYEVAFILIDYKGGGMAKSFENIPHTAGVITNLDGNGIKRSLASMRSELHRRERIFGETSQQHNVSNIDIYKYQKLYRDEKVREPLPHLFIISDEFAELKKEQPDFMTELTSTARVGRSLGVHLILATQKPGGVVDDQIRSNSRFRVCLKVQDSGDSIEMLGRTEAAELVDTGRFYLQVGNNEIFEIGQSAWAGAPYYPSSKVIKDRDDAVAVINTNGRVIAEANTDRFAMIKDPPKQLDVVTRYISKISEEEKIKRWKMWLDPIPEKIYIDDLLAKYNNPNCSSFVINPIIGEFDNPDHQLQGLLRVPLTSDGNVVIYGAAGNGKAMFIEAMCYSLLSEYSPNEVNIYILDFDAEMLTAFSEAPHVGDVVLSHEAEKVNNLIKMLFEKIDTRKKLLVEFGGDMLQYNLQTDNPEPSIIVIINNYAIFNELNEELSGDIAYLTREGTKYGLYFVLACTGINDIRYNMLQNFKSVYCLQLNNADDYSSVVGNTGGLRPDKHKGRGMFRHDKDHVFEFQVAHLADKESTYGFVREISNVLADKHIGMRAANIPILPDAVTQQYLMSHIEKGNLARIPIGVEKETLNIAYYNFATQSVHLALSLNQEWQGFTNALGAMLVNQADVKTIIIGFDTPMSDCARLISDIESAISMHNEKPALIIVQSFSALKSTLDRLDEGKELFKKLQVSIERCIKESNVHFLIAESIDRFSTLLDENWYKTHINLSNGIWVGSGISTQYKLTVNQIPLDYRAELETNFGFVICNSSATLVKFIQEEAMK